jgi:hypothetical protein
MNLDMSNLLNTGESSNSLYIIGSSTVRHLTLHISRIDPVVSKIIPNIHMRGVHERKIKLSLDNLLNLNRW